MANSNPNSFHIPPEWACRPPISVQYKLKRVSDPTAISKNEPAWDVVERAESSFVTFGREPPVDFWIHHDSVSRKHAILQYGNGNAGPGWYLYDLRSSHGTFINDEKISPKEYIFLEDDAAVCLGFASKYKFTLVSSVVKVDDGSEKLKISYNPPNWRKTIPDELKYTLEVIDTGSSVKEVSLSEIMSRDGAPNSYITIGAFPEVSQIKDDHPSVSRLHAVLQFGLLGKKYGWFLYDNGSSHGTKLNRARLTSRFYAKVPVGGSFKLGKSNKLFVLNLTNQEKEDEIAKEVLAKASVSSGSAAQIQKSEVKAYTADPIGWLTSHFETEGLSLEYSFVPTGDKKIVCSINLRDAIEAEEPVVRGEGVNRDEAKKNAAFVACKLIDEMNQFSSNGYGVSEFRTKRQEYEENDFYGSDEDEFFDRTGQLEERRKKRKNRIQNDDEEKKTLTYDDLIQQLEAAKKSLEAITISHEKIAEEARITKTLNSKFVLSASRQKLYTAQNEIRRLERLVDATRPANIEKAFTKSVKQQQTDSKPTTDIQVIVKKDEVVSSRTDALLKPLPETEKALVSEISETVAQSVEAATVKPVDAEKAALKAQGYGLVQREELQALKNNEIATKRRRIMEFEDNAFDDKPSSARDDAKEVEVAPEDDAVWLPPNGQTGDGKTHLNAKLGY